MHIFTKLLFSCFCFAWLLLPTALNAEEIEATIDTSTLPPDTELIKEKLYDTGSNTHILTIEYPSHIFSNQNLPVKATLIENHDLIDKGFTSCEYISTLPGTVDATFLDWVIVTQTDDFYPGDSVLLNIDTSTSREGNSLDFEIGSCWMQDLSTGETFEYGEFKSFEVGLVNPNVYPPTIEGPTTIDASNGYQLTNEDILNHFKASDYKNNDITNSIEIIGNNYIDNWNTTGSHSVILEVLDDQGGFSEKEITIVVNQNPGPNLTLIGESLIRVQAGTEFEDEGALAYSSDGSVLNYQVDGIVDSNLIGNYTLSYVAQDAAGNLSNTKTREIIVEDTTKPQIELIGKDELFIEYMDVWKEPGVTAHDNYDSDIEITITSNLLTNNLGQYLIRYNAMDSSGNRAHTIERIINVIDSVPPELSIESITTDINSVIENVTVREYFSANDNYDGDITDEIIIDMNSYLSSPNKTGEYTGMALIEDSNNNVTEKEFVISVIDNVAPIISGPSVIHKSKDAILNSDFFMEYYTAHDDHDGDMTGTIKIIDDAYSGNANQPGAYEITLEGKDFSENKSIFKMEIHVVDELLPLIIIDSNHFILDANVQMTPSKLITSLKQINTIPNQTFSLNTQIDTYSMNYDVIGNYNQVLELASDTGEDYLLDLNLEVIDASDNLIEATPSISSKVYSFVIDKWWLITIPILIILGLIKNRKV